MSKEQTQRGFGAVGTVAIVLILAVLAFAGWYVWQKNSNKKDTNKPNGQTSQNQNNDTKKPDEQKPVDPTEGGKYLVITEWGVRFPLSAQLQNDVDYGIFTFKNGDQAAYFASKNIAAKSMPGTCGLAPLDDETGKGTFGGLIAVTRSVSKPEQVDQRSFQYGSHWFTLGFSNGGACYEGDTGQESGAFKSAMDEAIKKLESVQQ